MGKDTDERLDWVDRGVVAAARRARRRGDGDAILAAIDETAEWLVGEAIDADEQRHTARAFRQLAANVEKRLGAAPPSPVTLMGADGPTRGWPEEKLRERIEHHRDKQQSGDRTLSRDGEVILWLDQQVRDLTNRVQSLYAAPEGWHSFHAPNSKGEIVQQHVAFTTSDTLQAILPTDREVGLQANPDPNAAMIAEAFRRFNNDDPSDGGER